MTKRLGLLFATLFILFFGSIGLDRVTGWLRPSHDQGLIFPRNVTVTLKTPEFFSTIRTNSMGFRDREFEPQKSSAARVLAIGDSFTFGWGVEDKESWPKVLESRLRSEGLNIEVANLGKPGASPVNYAELAEKSIPLLHPDLLIVAVLQGEDLAQIAFAPVGDLKLGQDTNAIGAGESHPTLRRTAQRLYPNFVAIADQTGRGPTQLADQWRTLAKASWDSLTQTEKARLEMLDASVKKAFFAGELNPSLVYLGVHSPDYFMETMNLNSPTARQHVMQMADQLKRIKSAADRNHAKLIVVSVPYGFYVSQASFETRRRIGFTAVPEMLTSAEPDNAIKQASQLAGADFCEVTSEFRHASVNQQLFFELDGHFNRFGHDLFAGALTPIIRDRLNPAAK